MEEDDYEARMAALCKQLGNIWSVSQIADLDATGNEDNALFTSAKWGGGDA